MVEMTGYVDAAPVPTVPVAEQRVEVRDADEDLPVRLRRIAPRHSASTEMGRACVRARDTCSRYRRSRPGSTPRGGSRGRPSIPAVGSLDGRRPGSTPSASTPSRDIAATISPSPQPISRYSPPFTTRAWLSRSPRSFAAISRSAAGFLVDPVGEYVIIRSIKRRQLLRRRLGTE